MAVDEVNPFCLQGATALVTGGGRGLGRGITESFLRAGADVIVASRQRPDEQMELLATEYERSLCHVELDLGDAEAIARTADKILNDREIGILVNNAGVQLRHDAIDFPLTDFDRVMDVNLRAVFDLAQRFGRPMLDRGYGKIINITSLTSFQGGLRVPAYTAAKGAVGQLTKALCNEWAPLGVNVNAIAPGYMATDLNTALLADSQRSHDISTRIPAGRWGEPGDVGGAAVFLASSASDYIHGVTLPVDGGWLAR